MPQPHPLERSFNTEDMLAVIINTRIFSPLTSACDLAFFLTPNLSGTRLDNIKERFSQARGAIYTQIMHAGEIGRPAGLEDAKTDIEREETLRPWLDAQIRTFGERVALKQPVFR